MLVPWAKLASKVSLFNPIGRSASGVISTLEPISLLALSIFGINIISPSSPKSEPFILIPSTPSSATYSLIAFFCVLLSVWLKLTLTPLSCNICFKPTPASTKSAILVFFKLPVRTSSPATELGFISDVK